MKRLLIVAFFFEFGIALLVVPWSSFWDRNYFAEVVPMIHTIIRNNFVRGAVSGLGIVNIAAGLVRADFDSSRPSLGGRSADAPRQRTN